MGNLKVGEVVQLPALVKVFAHYHLWIVCLWHGRCCAQALEEALFPFSKQVFFGMHILVVFWRFVVFFLFPKFPNLVDSSRKFQLIHAMI